MMRTFIDEVLSFEETGRINRETSKNEVKEVQRMLNQLLHLQLKEDGQLGGSGSNTRTALGIFQGLANLPLTKNPDKKTVSRLKWLLNRQLPLSQRLTVFDNFDLKQSILKEDHIPLLCTLKSSIVRHIKTKRIDTIYFTGHTDITGSKHFNRTLSRNRAQEVIRHLLTAWRCDPRIKIDLQSLFVRFTGFGETHPIPRASHEKNRRVEALLLFMKR